MRVKKTKPVKNKTKAFCLVDARGQKEFPRQGGREVFGRALVTTEPSTRPSVYDPHDSDTEVTEVPGKLSGCVCLAHGISLDKDMHTYTQHQYAAT